MSESPPAPKEFVGITKEYLERVLKTRIKHFDIYPGSSPGDGYSCALYSVNVWKSSRAETPARILIKCFPPDRERQEFLEISNSFYTELRFYDSILPELVRFQAGSSKLINPPCAPFIWGNCIPKEERNRLQIPLHSAENCIIMPDLRAPSNGGFKPYDRFQSFDLDHYSLVIEGQATLHALSWAYKFKTGTTFAQKYPFLETNGDWYKMLDSLLHDSIRICEKIILDYPSLQEGFQHLEAYRYSIAGLYFGFAYGQDSRGHTKDTILKYPGEVVDKEEPWSVLLHGDTWSNNMLFRYDEKTKKPVEVNFVDFQLVHEGDPCADICYTLFVSTNKAFRKKNLNSLLHSYFDTFTEICHHFAVPCQPGWNWEEFQRRFRRASIFGGYMAITCLPIFLMEPQDIETTDSKGRTQEADAPSFEPHAEVFADIHVNTRTSPALVERLVGVLEDLVETGVV